MTKLCKILIAVIGLVLLWSGTLFWRKNPIEHDLSQKVQAALQAPDFSRTVISFVGRDGTLSGEVNTPGLAARAEQLARAPWGVRVIRNQLRWPPPARASVADDSLRLQEEIAEKKALQQQLDEFFGTHVVEFATGSADLTNTSRAILNQAAELLKKASQYGVTIAGHTDDVGATDFNQRLSQTRAEAVRAFLIQEGVISGQLTAIGYGSTRPRIKNNDMQSRQRNRRVEFTTVN